MRLLTHNLLCGPNGGYPLKLRAESIQELSSPFEEEFVRRLLTKLEWAGLLSVVADLQACSFLADLPPLPASVPNPATAEPGLLRTLHRLLNEVKVLEGTLECPETHTTFPINGGIPKMLLDGGQSSK
eukprot:RCo043747